MDGVTGIRLLSLFAAAWTACAHPGRTVETAPPSVIDAAYVRCRPALTKLRSLGQNSWEGRRYYDWMAPDCQALADGRPLRPSARPPPDRPSRPVHEECIGSCGWLAGAAVGIGLMGTRGLVTRGDWGWPNMSSSLTARVGRTLRSRWDLALELDEAASNNGYDCDVWPCDFATQFGIGPLLQYWYDSIWFVRGGLVVSKLALEDRNGGRYTAFGPGLSGALGLHYGHGEYSARIAAARYEPDGRSSLSGEPWLVHVWIMFGVAR